MRTSALLLFLLVNFSTAAQAAKTQKSKPPKASKPAAPAPSATIKISTSTAKFPAAAPVPLKDSTAAVQAAEEPQPDDSTPIGTIKLVAWSARRYKVAKKGELLSEPQRVQNEKTSRILLSRLNIPRIAQDSLGEHWSRLTQRQRDEFTGVLNQLFEKLTTSKANTQFFGNFKIEYRKETIQDGRAWVLTQVQTREADVGVEYRLVRESAAWKVIDILVDDVSTVETYQTDFDRIIAEEGFAKLLEKLRKKLKE